MSIFERVSIREFTEEKVNKFDVEMILRAAMQAPSAVNQQPWEFMVCEDISAIRKFSEQGMFARSLKTAPMLLILYYRENVSHPMFVMQDMGACTENALLQVTSLGLGAVWMGVAPKEDRMSAVEECFGKVDGCRPFSLIAVGHKKEDKQQISRFDESRIHYYNK